MEFETEEQQVEAIKKWLKEYGMTIVVGLVLGLVGIFGYRYYIEQQEHGLEQLSDSYESVMVILTEQNDNEKFIAEAAAFNKANSKSIYSNLLSLQLAKLAVDQKDLGTAAQHLRDAKNNAQHGTIEHIARIRLVRVLIAQSETDEALTIISESTGDEYKSSYEMLRGDIWMAKGDRSRASQAYASAKESGADGPTAPSLDMLLTDLAQETATADVE